MNLKENFIKPSHVLQGVVDNHSNDTISFYEISSALHEKGFGFLLLIFSLPILLPLPPGVSTLPSIPVIIFAIQMLMGFNSPWLPASLGKRTIERETLSKIVGKVTPYLLKVESKMRPRLKFVSSKLGERIIGFIALLLAIPIALPMPLSNFIPGLGIVLMSLGLVMTDGLLVIVGATIGFIGFVICFSIAIFGTALLYSMFSF